MTQLSNWARSVSFTPGHVASPGTVDELCTLLRETSARGGTMRVMGAGHSFTPLVATDDILVRLDRLSGLVRVEGNEVTFWGGTPLHRVAGLLAPWGLALPNMGDIDRQSIAGALSTGTHGTGLAFPGYAGMVTRLRLALPDGSLVDCSPEKDSDLFDAARVGLGAFGVVVEVTVRCVPTFALVSVETTEPLAGILDTFLERSRRADHLEFFWFPGTPRVTVKQLDRMPADSELSPLSTTQTLVGRELLGNWAFGAMTGLARWSAPMAGPTRAVASRLMAGPAHSDLSHKVFVTPRRVRFREAEYAVPLDAFPEVLQQVGDAVIRSGHPVTFPFEVRTTAADDAWLSQSGGRASVHIAVHRQHREPFDETLAVAEPILRAHGGRPHWGKEHTLTAPDVTALYPRADDARAVRRRVDPDGVLLNPHVRALLGERVSGPDEG